MKLITALNQFSLFRLIGLETIENIRPNVFR